MSVKVKAVHDLSVTVGDEDVTWVLAPSVKITRRRIIGQNDNVNAEDLVTPVHFGTHVDFPFHNIPDGFTGEHYPASLFIGRGNFIDVSHKKENEVLMPSDLEGHDIQEGDVVLLYYNWYRYRGRNDKYLYDYPGLGVEAAKYLVAKKIRGVGTDAYNIEQTPRETIKGPFYAHIELHKKDIWIIEALTDDFKGLIGRKDLMVAAFPIKLAGVSGAPARVVAIEFAN